MKIDATSNYPPVYRTGNNGSAAKAATPAAGRANKTDVVDFSRGQTVVPDKSAASLKVGLLRDIAAPTDSERLAALKADIKAGNYRASTDELVDSILNL